MPAFLTKDFLLATKTARRLYFDHAAKLPIIDYHCHISPREIWENKRFSDLYEVWLAGDHYKWRLMRANGIDERYITGDAAPYEKFCKFAETLPLAIGNPMYHWCHLELKNYFGYEGVLNADTANEVWELAKKKLSEENMHVRGLIAQSNVEFIGTTDDPIDSLEYHALLAADESFAATVAPTFRPDNALSLLRPDWCGYIEKLSEAAALPITSMETLKEALRRRMDHFAAHGCRASDHGPDNFAYAEAAPEELDRILKKRLAGESVSAQEAAAVETALLLYCAGEYKARGWAMQLHYNCLRNPNSQALAALGPNTGFDCIGPKDNTRDLAALLDALSRTDRLPRMILYSLDGSDNAFLDCLIGAFQGTEVPGQLQHGSAWWFNDHKAGMREQMISLANLGLLGNFVGMLTDSRSFLSYTRHEYFRRILCGLIGEWVENGEYPNDEAALGTLVEKICYFNAKRYFNL